MANTKKGAGLCLVAALVASPSGAGAGGPCVQDRSLETRELAAGISLTEESCSVPEYRAFIVQVDLDAPGLDLVVTPYKDRLRTTSEFATATGAFLAVNGGFWGDDWGGFTVSGGSLWPKKNGDLETSTVVGFGTRDDKGLMRVEIRPTEEVLVTPPAWMRHALTGIPLLLEEGRVVETQIDHTIFLHKHPRTALGLSEDGATMWIAVVDGRQPGYSTGMKTSQLARLLASHGAWRAVNLDGGASSTLVVPTLGGLVNDPCYKKADERPVPNHLGILLAGTGHGTGPLARLLAPLRLVGRLLAG